MMLGYPISFSSGGIPIATARNDENTYFGQGYNINTYNATNGGFYVAAKAGLRFVDYIAIGC